MEEIGSPPGPQLAASLPAVTQGELSTQIIVCQQQNLWIIKCPQCHCSRVSAAVKSELRVLFRNLCQDDTPMVRRYFCPMESLTFDSTFIQSSGLQVGSWESLPRQLR